MGHPHDGMPHFLLTAVLILVVVLIVVLVAVLVLVLVIVLIAVLVLILVIHYDFLRYLYLRTGRSPSMPNNSGFILGFEQKAGKKSGEDGGSNASGSCL